MPYIYNIIIELTGYGRLETDVAEFFSSLENPILNSYPNFLRVPSKLDPYSAKKIFLSKTKMLTKSFFTFFSKLGHILDPDPSTMYLDPQHWDMKCKVLEYFKMFSRLLTLKYRCRNPCLFTRSCSESWHKLVRIHNTAFMIYLQLQALPSPPPWTRWTPTAAWCPMASLLSTNSCGTVKCVNEIVISYRQPSVLRIRIQRIRIILPNPDQ